MFLQDLYGKDVGATEKQLPSRIEKAAKHHNMPFSPSAQKVKNVNDCSTGKFDITYI